MDEISEEFKIRYQAYLDERESLNTMELEVSGRYDKWILTLSGGALAISVTFIEKIAPSPEPENLKLLFLAWFLFIITIVLSLTSHLTSQSAIRRQRDIIDEKLISKSPEEIVEKNTYSKITNWFNIISIVFFFLGVLSICTFSIMSFPTKDMTEKNIKSKVNLGSYTTVEKWVVHLKALKEIIELKP